MLMLSAAILLQVLALATNIHVTLVPIATTLATRRGNCATIVYPVITAQLPPSYPQLVLRKSVYGLLLWLRNITLFN